jgi:hypothetical protein
MDTKVLITVDALGKEVTVFEDKRELTCRQLDLLIIAIQKAVNKLLTDEEGRRAQDSRLYSI